jgi:tRNA A37 methylthiotransferase MiaB
MMTPNCTLKLLDALINAYKNEKVYKFLHLPVQSGDNNVLTLMNRSYSVEVFKRIVNTFRKRFPRVTIATDIICGFPREGEDAFERTVELIREIQPDVVNISKFFPRPNTGAGQMKLLSNQIVNDRSRRMTKLVRDVLFKKNKSWLDWVGEILVSEKGKVPNTWIGRNFAYKPIVIKMGNHLLGKFLSVRVVKAFPTYLEAEIM